MKRWSAILAGACAMASGLASIGYVAFGQPGWAITAWNVLIIPAALYLGIHLGGRMPFVSTAAAAAGVGASILWAFGFRNGTIEPWWIGLAALWWLGAGIVMPSAWRRTGWLTLALGITAAADFVVTLLDLRQPWLALGGLKLPLTTVWSIWVGIALVRDDVANREPLGARSAARALAVVGGLVWAACASGWLLTHGIQPDPVNAEILGLTGTELTQLLAVAPLFWAVSLVILRPRAEQSGPTRASWAVALVGVVMVGTGALLETSLVDPNLYFTHPAVQGGWLLYIGGLFPVMCAGLLGMAATSRSSRTVRTAYLVAGALAPMEVLAFVLGALASQGTAWTVTFAVLHAAPGIGWIVIGLADDASAAVARSAVATAA